jgi:hypothetical protein
MSVIERLKGLYTTFLCLSELPREIENLIFFNLILEINTLYVFEIPKSDAGNIGTSLLEWSGEYTDGYIDDDKIIQIRFHGDFGKIWLDFDTLFPLMILSIEHKSMYACSPSSTSYEKTLRIDPRKKEEYIRSHGEDDALVIMNGAILTSDIVKPVLNELKLIWEMCTYRGLSYKNGLLCVGKSLSPNTNTTLQRFNILKWCGVYKVNWAGKYTEGSILCGGIILKFGGKYSGEISIKGILPALLLAIQYGSTSKCFVKALRDLSSPPQTLFHVKKSKPCDLYRIFGDIALDTVVMECVLGELTQLWDTCVSKGLWYKDNELCTNSSYTGTDNYELYK